MSQLITCNFQSKSLQRCSASHPAFQTLEDLEKSAMKIPGKHMKISWLILSRVGVHYLSSNFASWTICQVHRKEFLDGWQVPDTCTYPDHLDNAGSASDNAGAKHLVNIVMSVKLLQKEGKVVPISSKFCQACHSLYNDKYSSKPGERLLVIVPKPKPVITSSPFELTTPEDSGPGSSSSLMMNNIRSRGVLTSSEKPKVILKESRGLVQLLRGLVQLSRGLVKLS